MSDIIQINNLTKYYKVYKKEPGVLGSLRALFSRSYETVRAVEDISFSIQQGELIGFIGPNGAGKTTTLKVLSGLLYPTSGKVSVLGFNPWDRKEAFQKQFSLVMGQKNQLWWDLPAMESFLLNKAIYEIPDAQFHKTLDTLVELLDIKDVLKIQVRKLSLGQRMKCELIAALLHSPKVLFLDEPTIGLDVVMQKVMRDFIRDYNKEFGATIILTSHYMEDVKELCKRVIIIDHGKKLFDGELKSIIDAYAVNKILSVVLFEEVSREKLEKIGKIRSYNHPQITLLVPRKEATKRAATLLQNFPVADITIEEPPIEAIIRDVFQHGK
ncbi:MAG: ATP-binding cassette domain-containing protein [Candidatus Pacebacteria bacterium]|nr:ATP-binding cassette domain-containing protein [Candidatus Paceibacterota bacterium]